MILAAAALLRFLWLDSVPPGWHHDEALMGIMASEVYRGVQRPIFFPGYLGQEPLYIYLSAGMMWLMGGNQDILPLRIVSAAIGLATVGVTYVLGREMFGRRAGLIGAALLAFSSWHLVMSRDGYRMISQPLLEGITVVFLLMAIRKNSLWCYAVAGAALGGTLYTYLGGRLFPGVFILFGLWWLLARGLPPARMRIGAGIFAVAAVAVALPLLLYFATHPGTFSARIDQISVIGNSASASDALGLLWKNAVRQMEVFTVQGDGTWRFNLPGRPMFGPTIGLLFYLGLLVVTKDALKRRIAGGLALTWFVVMLFPNVFSTDVGFNGSTRAVGLLPVLFLLPAVGAVAVWDFVEKKAPGAGRKFARVALASVVGVVLLVEAETTYREYFTNWATAFGSAYENMADVVAEARYLDREARPGDEEVFVSSDYYTHPVVAHLTPRVYPHVRWFDGNSALVLSPDSGKDSLYVFPLSALPRHLDDYLPAEALVESSYFDNGQVKFLAYRLSPTQAREAVDRIVNAPSFTRTSKVFGDDIQLIAYRVERRVVQGGKLALTAVWRVLKDAPKGHYVVSSQLLDNHAGKRGQFDTPAFPAEQWRAGDILIGDYNIPVEGVVTPGRYSAVLGIYDRATMKGLPVRQDPAGNTLVHLAYVKVACGDATCPTPADAVGTPVNKALGDTIELAGFEAERADKAAPPVLKVKFYWRATSTPDEDYTVFVQLLNDEGRLAAQSDSQPAQGGSPTSFWEPGEITIDAHELKLEGLPPGRYTLIAGMYLLSTGRRLATDGGDHLVLTTIDLHD